MAGVKFVVIYPRPTDVEVFEKLYREEHIPMALKNWSDQDRRNKDSGLSAGYASVLPHCGDPLSVTRGVEHLCGVGRSAGHPGSRRIHLDRR